MEKLIEIVSRIANFLIGREFDPICEVKSFSLSNDQTLNFKTLGNNKGIRGFTVQNEGKSFMYVGEAKQKIVSGGSHTINLPFRLSNEQFEIVFGETDPNADASLPNQQAVVNYLLDTKC